MIIPFEIPQLDIPDNHVLYFFSFQSVKSFQYKRFIQTACLLIGAIFGRALPDDHTLI